VFEADRVEGVEIKGQRSEGCEDSERVKRDNSYGYDDDEYKDDGRPEVVK
jgi:hypothetical protein